MSASPHRRDPFLGLTLAGQYEITGALARGGMGRVYRAKQLTLGRDVALKVLDMEQLEGQSAEDFQQRFFNEAAACAKLTHPNTVVVYDYGKTDDEIYFIVMELLTGDTLRQAIKSAGVMAPSRAMHIALQICGSLGEAHEQGMVHRDLKPSNIMLIPRGNDPEYVKVLDFGLVKHADNELTQSGALLGTPRYMAPEQISGEAVGPAADIYSLGALIYHMLTGRPPFDSESKFVLLASHMNVAAPSIREVCPDSPASDELIRVVMRCLLKEPGARFDSMNALARALAFCPEDTTTAQSSMPRNASGIGAAELPPDELASTSVAKPSAARDLALAEANAATLSDEKPTSPEAAADSVPPVEAAASAATPPPRPRRTGAVLAVAILVGAVLALGAAYAWKSGTADESVDALATFEDPTREFPVGARAETNPNAQTTNEPSVATPPTTAPTAGAESVRVEVHSDPTGARVRRGESDLGDTPVTLVLPRGESWELTLSSAGYEARTISITGGQEQANVSLRRRSSGGRPGMQTSPMVEPSMVEPSMVEPTMVEPTMVEPTMVEGGNSMMNGTDNRDPWAR